MTDAKRDVRPGGRPPDPDADRRILAAAQKLLATQGFSRMSIEGVAAESGVAKTTIYRRFSDKADLATAAIGDLIPRTVPEPTDDAHHDLRAQLEFNRRVLDMAIVGTPLVEERGNPALLDAFRERVLRPRMTIFRQIIASGIERGELRADLDAEAVADLVLGSYLFRYLLEGRPDKDWPRRVLDAVWPALRAK